MNRRSKQQLELLCISETFLWQGKSLYDCFHSNESIVMLCLVLSVLFVHQIWDLPLDLKEK